MGVPIALINGWVTWLDLAMLAVIYMVGVHGITIGYHRLFTHSAFTAGRTMRAVLALAGSLAVEGRVVDWVADHRKHHQFSDVDGDPHSPWEYGPGTRGLTKGFIHAHVGWLFTYSGTDTAKYAPDLIADRAIDRISRLWPLIAVISMVVPTAIGYAVDGWARRGARVLLGDPRPRGPGAPHDVVDQLGLPCLGQPALRHPRPQRERCVARTGVRRRVVAQLPPRRPLERTARGAAPSAGHVRHRHPRPRARRAGRRP